MNSVSSRRNEGRIYAVNVIEVITWRSAADG